MVEEIHIMGAKVSQRGNWGPESTSESMSPITYFLQLGPTYKFSLKIGPIAEYYKNNTRVCAQNVMYKSYFI